MIFVRQKKLNLYNKIMRWTTNQNNHKWEMQRFDYSLHTEQKFQEGYYE